MSASISECSQSIWKKGLWIKSKCEKNVKISISKACTNLITPYNLENLENWLYSQKNLEYINIKKI